MMNQYDENQITNKKHQRLILLAHILQLMDIIGAICFLSFSPILGSFVLVSILLMFNIFNIEED